MILELFLLQCVVAYASIMKVGESYFHQPLSLAPNGQFYPPYVHLVPKNQKKDFEYEAPDLESRAVTDWYESIPTELRIEHIQNFLELDRRDIIFFDAKSRYQEFLLSTMFIDVRVFRLLVRFATNNLLPDETHIRTASRMITHLKKQFYDVDFSYLTPNYIMEWHNMLGHSNFSVYVRSGLTDPSKVPDDTLLQIKPGIWKEYILAPRLRRLIETGYEFF